MQRNDAGMIRSASWRVVTAIMLLLICRVHAAAPAPAASSSPVSASIATTQKAGYSSFETLTSSSHLINGQHAMHYGNVSASTVQAACAQIAAGATNLKVSVSEDTSDKFTESLQLWSPTGGATAAQATGTTSTAKQVAQTCVKTPKGIEFTFKDQANRQVAVLCEQPSVCEVYVLGARVEAVWAALKKNSAPQNKSAPPIVAPGSPLASALANALMPADGGSTAGRRLLQSSVRVVRVSDYNDCIPACRTFLGCPSYPLNCGIDCDCQKEDSFCFPANAQVHVQGRGPLAMSELQVGDRVASLDASHGFTFEEVYFFGHRSRADVTNMLSITCSNAAGNATLTLTSRHFVPVGGNLGTTTMKYARDVVVGDLLMVASEGQAVAAATVTDITSTIQFGLYNPYTKNGLLLVDNVLASAHSEFLLDDVTPARLSHYLPGVYQIMLKPIFWLYKLVGPQVMHSFRVEKWALVPYAYTLGIALASGAAFGIARKSTGI